MKAYADNYKLSNVPSGNAISLSGGVVQRNLTLNKTKDQKVISVTDLPSGTYSLMISSSGKSLSAAKFVIIH